MIHPILKTGLICPVPFELLHIDHLAVLPCCKSYLLDSVHDVCKSTNISDYINIDLVEFKTSILDGSYKYCSDLCPYNKYSHKDMFELLSFNDIDLLLNSIPYKLILSNDTACNLVCKSCRTTPLITDMDSIHLNESQFSYLFPNIQEVKIAGMGDPFFSKYYFNMLQRNLKEKFVNIQKLDLHTNGLLFNEANFNKIHEYNRDILNTVEISIDASSSDTYKTVRNGNFTMLLNNLKYIKTIKNIKELNTTFTVNRYNFHEMGDFILLCDDYGFDYIRFTPAMKWANAIDVRVDIKSDEFNMALSHAKYIALTKNINIDFMF